MMLHNQCYTKIYKLIRFLVLIFTLLNKIFYFNSVVNVTFLNINNCKY